MFAIIDLETTGGSVENEAITEIAIYKYDGNRLVDQFISMVNPQRPIQPFVVKLTGISNKMLKKAPKFYEIAKRIVEITEGCTLVAHNADFDYRVLKKEFARLGYSYERPRICTVKLSRKLIPGQKSYSLGKLCRSLHIPVTDRHRASGDALATLELFKLLQNKNRNLNEAVETDKKIQHKIQPKILKILDNLPEKKGILYLYNAKDELIAVLQTSNIKRKLNSIYLKTNPKSIQLQRSIDRVEYELLSGSFIGKIITWHNRYINNLEFSPCTKRNFNKKIAFDKENFLLIDKGHHSGEKAIVYVEQNKVIGYGFYKLNWEKESTEIIKKRLTEIEEHPFLRQMIYEHIRKKRYLDLIEL